MNNADLYNVIRVARKTLIEELKKYPVESYNQDIIINTDSCFRSIIEWDGCIGELLVEEPDCAPYRYVSFNILSYVTEEITPVFCWYDSMNDSLETIVNKIKEGICLAFNYRN